MRFCHLSPEDRFSWPENGSISISILSNSKDGIWAPGTKLFILRIFKFPYKFRISKIASIVSI
jgi:hypothetical protein